MNVSNLIDYDNPQLILVGSRPEVNRSKLLIDCIKYLREKRPLSVSYYTFGYMGPDFRNNVHKLPTIDESSFSVVSGGFITLEQLCDFCRRRTDSRMIVLDWLHLPAPEMEKMVKGLRRVADETNRVIIAIFNTPRIKDQNKRLLEDMAAVVDMGEVYDLADDIWFLYPEDSYAKWDKQIIDLVIGKGKLVKSQEIKNKDLLGDKDRCYDIDVLKKVHQRR